MVAPDDLPIFHADDPLAEEVAKLRRSIAEGSAEMWVTEEQIRGYRRREARQR